jgi:5-methylcytosine-specific restriction endonuclease McrA
MSVINQVKNSCKHQTLVEIKTTTYNNYIGEYETDYEWVWKSTEEDIDLHRYKCTQCGEIGYYSSAAENYYTKGIKNPMLGPNCV